MKKLLTILAVAAAMAAAMPSYADATDEGSSGFSGWRVSAGARFGFGLRTKLRFGVPGNAVYVPTSPALGSPAAIDNALNVLGNRVSFLDGAFIDPSSGTMASPYTQNWRIPVSALNTTTGAITLNSAQTTGGAAGYGADDDTAFGTSIELSRTLYADERGFGVDFAAGLSWMRCNNCFKSSASGTYLGSSTYVYTPSMTGSNYSLLTSPFLTPTAGYYGSGSPGMGPVLDYSDINATTLSQTTGSSDFSVSGSGDYEEWEISLLLRPWWEVTEWWRLTGTIGVGVTRSEFEGIVNGVLSGSGAYSARNTYHEWNCYGIAGLGTVFRLWRLDLSFDVLARFLQDDFSINSDLFSGTISKPNIIFCSSLGFEF